MAIIFLLLFTRSVNTWLLVGGEKLKFIGLFSICEKSENRTEFNDRAYVFDKTAKHIFSNTSFLTSRFYLTDLMYEFVSYDVCTLIELKEKALDFIPFNWGRFDDPICKISGWPTIWLVFYRPKCKFG